MAIEGIYLPDSNSNIPTITGKGTSELDMNDFMNLLVAQMTNQDMMNPVEDTEFIAQMAQFSALQGIQTIQEYQLSSYAASYAGKYVTIADTNELGALETISGKVDAISFYDGKPKVQVNGKTYDLFKVMEVSDAASTGSLAEASKYIGQSVTVRTKNEFGETVEVTGKVTGVTITDNVPQVIVDGKEYPISAVTNVDEKAEGNLSEASKYIGKSVTVNGKNAFGEAETVTGKVTGVTVTDGVPQVIIDGKEYPASTVTAVDEAAAATATSAASASADVLDLGQHIARVLAGGGSNDPSSYSYEEILAYATTIASPKTGSSVRTPAEIAQLILDSGRMK